MAYYANQKISKALLERIDPSASKPLKAELRQRAVDEHADVGSAFDGDDDRFFTIDELGQFVP